MVLREQLFEPYRDELWRSRVSAGHSPRARLEFWASVIGGFGAAAVYSVPRYLRGPEGAARIGSVPVVLLASLLLLLTVLVDDCFYAGLLAALPR